MKVQLQEFNRGGRWRNRRGFRTQVKTGVQDGTNTWQEISLCRQNQTRFSDSKCPNSSSWCHISVVRQKMSGRAIIDVSQWNNCHFAASQVNQELPSDDQNSNVHEVCCHNEVNNPTKVVKIEEYPFKEEYYDRVWKYSNLTPANQCHNGIDNPTKIAKMEDDHVRQKIS